MRGFARTVPAAWLALTAALAPGSSLAGQMLDIPAQHDNTLFQSVTGDVSDGAGPVFFAGTSGTSVRRALLRFDVAGALPAGAVITDASVIILLAFSPSGSGPIMGLYRVLHDWGEGSSSTASIAGAPATTGDASWLYTFYPGASWSTPGGDFVATTSSAHGVAGFGGFHAWEGGTLAADVQSWLDDPAHNYGWLMKGDEINANTARTFASREDANAINRPRLRVVYDAPIAIRASSWSRLKRLYR